MKTVVPKSTPQRPETKPQAYVPLRVLGRHDGPRPIHIDLPIIGAHGDLLVALRAKVGRLLEPVGETGDASQADAEQAAQHARDTGEACKVSKAVTGKQTNNNKIRQAAAHICIDVPSVASRVLVRRWQKGQSIHWGWSPSMFSGVTVGTGCCGFIGSWLDGVFRLVGRSLTGAGGWTAALASWGPPVSGLGV